MLTTPPTCTLHPESTGERWRRRALGLIGAVLLSIALAIVLPVREHDHPATDHEHPPPCELLTEAEPSIEPDELCEIEPSD